MSETLKNIRSTTELAVVHQKLEATRGFTVCATQCKNCLFGEERLVGGSDAARIIKSTREANTYFACHEFSDYHADDEDEETDAQSSHYSPTQVCCKAYYELVGEDAQQIRMAQRLNLIRFVDRDGNIVKEPEISHDRTSLPGGPRESHP